MKQIDLARKLRVSRPTISAWEHNRALPDLHILQTIAHTLDTNVAYLIGASNLPHKNQVSAQHAYEKLISHDPDLQILINDITNLNTEDIIKVQELVQLLRSADELKKIKKDKI